MKYGDGTLVSTTFNVSPASTTGTYPVSVTVEVIKTLDEQYNQLDLAYELINGAVEIENGVKVSGKVGSYNPKNETIIELVQNGEAVYTVTIPATAETGWKEQDFAFHNVAPGTYSLVVSKDTHLKTTINNITVGGTDIDISQDIRADIAVIKLRCGNLNSDRQIGPSDLAVLLSNNNYMKNVGEGGALEPRTDLNGDLQVGPSDLAILLSSANYMKEEVVIEY
jgi:hypothetical protein